MKTARRFGIAAALAAFALAGCSFGRFDTARNDVVVDSFGTPVGGAGFGLVLATTNPAASPSVLMVSSKSPAAAARFEFTGSGKRNVTKYISGDKFKPGGGEIGSIAGAVSGDFAMAVGPDGSRQVVFINPAGEVNATPGAPTPSPGYGMAVALVDVYRPAISPAADPSDFDGIVASSNEIFVYPDRGTRDVVLRCVTGAMVTDGLQSLTAGDVVTSNDNVGSKGEIVVGKPSKSVAGSVLISNVAPIAGKLEDIPNSVVFSTDMCPAVMNIIAPGGEKSFGTKVVLGQVTGSDDLDLIVSAPSENAVYVFPGSPDGPVATSAIKIDAPAGGSSPGSFGASIAVVDLDGDGKGEIAIGEPNATVGGKANAGRVHMYNVSSGAPVKVGEPLSKHTPVSDQQFGSAVAALRVTPAGMSARDELVVGTNSEVLVYFTTLYTIDHDERTK